MKSYWQFDPVTWPTLAWLTVALAGLAGPAAALIWIANTSPGASLAQTGGPILAVALMGAGIIAGAASGRYWVGLALGLLSGAILIGLAIALGMPTRLHPLYTGLAVLAASVSFAARGALFAKSGGAKGWWIAVCVVAGEAAILLTSWIEPGMWPKWLLSLLPAQWANISIQAALTGSASHVAQAALLALAATAAATLLVAGLWPRRWTYLIMFTTWLGMAALVHHQPDAPAPNLGGDAHVSSFERAKRGRLAISKAKGARHIRSGEPFGKAEAPVFSACHVADDTIESIRINRSNQVLYEAVR